MFAKATIVGVALMFAATTLEKVAGTLGLVAGIIVALGIIFTGSRQLWRFVRRLESVVENTAALPEFMAEQRVVQDRLTEENERVHVRLDAGAERMGRIEGALEALAQAERAAVRGALDAVTQPRKPRPSRRTDET